MKHKIEIHEINKERQKNNSVDFAIVIPSYNRYTELYNLLRDLENQNTLLKFKIILVLTGDVNNLNLDTISKHEIDLVVVIGKSDWWWTKSVSIGIDLALKNYTNVKNLLLINDDVRIPFNYLEEIRTKLRKFPTKTIIYSMIKENSPPYTFLETGTILDKKIKKDTQVPHTEYIKRELCTARGTTYPKGLFEEKSLFFNHRLFPHHYADIMLSHRATKKGYEIVGSREIFVLSDNLFGSEQIPDKLLKRFFGISSPKRILSVLLFWILFWF